MNVYVAFLRGVNVGGNALVKMVDLQKSLSEAGLKDVSTYIQSGNVIFKSEIKDADKLANLIKAAILKNFKLDVGVAVFSRQEWADVIAAAPKWWGKDTAWKHNMIIMLKPYDIPETVKAVGELKPDIEAMEPGKGVLYQSMSFKLFGRTTTGKLASNSIYKRMTIRNFNTANKILNILEAIK